MTAPKMGNHTGDSTPGTAAASPTGLSVSDFIDKLPAAVWAKDARGRYLFANPAYQQFFELPAQQAIVGRTDDDFFSSADAAAFRTKDRAIIETGNCEQFYEPVHLSSGVKHVLTLKFPLRDQRGQPYAACGMCFDITDSVLLREGLEKVNSRLALREEQLLALSRSPAIDAGELEASLRLVAAAASLGLDVARVSIWLWDEPHDSLRCMQLLDRHGGALPTNETLLRRSEYPRYFQALDEELTIDAQDAQNDPRTRELREGYFQVEGITSTLDTPIRLEGETVGVLCCEHIGPVRIWGEQENSFGAALAETIGRTLVAQRRRESDAALRELNQQLETRVQQEIREAKRAEAEAQTARQHLKDITDHIPGSVSQLLWLRPGEFRFLYISEGIFRMCGMTPEDFKTRQELILKAVYAEDLPGLVSAIDAAALLPGVAIDYPFRVQHAQSGELRWIHVQSRGRALPEGGVLFNGSFTDITARKQLEDAVAENERLLKAAMAASADGIWEWNLATDEVFFSPRWFGMLGYPDRHLPYQLETFTQLCHPDDQQNTFAQVARTVEAEIDLPYAAEFRMLCADGSWRWVLGRGSISARDEKGRPLRLTGTNSDIDAHKRLEASLATATSVAQSASRAKSDFLANMSHEIRTPMNAVIGLAELLADTPLAPKQRDYLDKLRGASRTLLALINDVLDLSKIEAGKLHIEQTAFSLSQVLDALASITSTHAASKNLLLQITRAPEIPDCLVGDSLRLGQVLLYLVGNAIKFTESGGVSVQVSPIVGDGGICLRFAVRDTGIGIPPERLSELFQPFQQADTSISRRYGGTGLGLTISQQLVTLMGGEMGVESMPHEGSIFWFTAVFATCDGLQLPNASPVRDAATSLAGLRVLVAEDNDINLEILTELLHRAGVEVRAARDGGEAVAICAGGWPELVLMDMQMPDIDGLAATAILRSDPRFAALPIIALTANAMSEDRTRCLEAGMNDHLPKPIEVEDLYAMLRRWRP